MHRQCHELGAANAGMKLANPGPVPVGALLACLALALAQEPGPPVDSPRAVAGSSRPRASPLDRRSAHRLWRITVSLRLDARTADRLFATLERHDRLIAAFRTRRAALMQEIQAAADRRAGDLALSVLIDRWVQLQEERRAIHAARWRALAPLLSLQQQARLLLLLPRLDSGGPG
jgi:hypothetical protein